MDNPGAFWYILYQEYTTDGEDSDTGRKAELKQLKGLSLIFNYKDINEK